jgi:hypothetical protein
MIRAIETHYNGYRFRSRLEARWAVFLDTLGVDWEYEKEGYDLGEAGRYLPDFWLSKHGYWVEIKGQEPGLDERKKMETLALQSGKSVYIFVGDPGTAETPCLGEGYSATFDPVDGTKIDECAWDNNQVWCDCEKCGAVGIEFAARNARLCRCYYPNDRYSPSSGVRLQRAYIAARSARFEYDETPVVVERVVYRAVDSPILHDMDLLVRGYGTSPTPADLLNPHQSILCHLNDGGVPLCAPIHTESDGGFNLSMWGPMRADVLVSKVCRRCLKYSASRAVTRNKAPYNHK